MGDLHLNSLAQLFEDTMPFRPKELGESIRAYNNVKQKFAYNYAKMVVRGPILDRMLDAQEPAMRKGSPKYWKGVPPLKQIRPSEMRAIFRRIISVLQIKSIDDKYLRITDMKHAGIKLNDKGEFNLSDVYKPKLNEAITKSIEGSFKEYIKTVSYTHLRAHET